MIKVLGASGSLDKNHECISFLIAKNIAIDAGNLMRPLGKDSNNIEHVFLTHAHFDHIRDLPFLIETHFESRKKPLTIYGLKQTIERVEQNLFNGTIWPQFQHILHPKSQQTLLSFKILELDQTVTVDDYKITPTEAVHTSGACGFIVKKNNVGCLISGDTYFNPHIAEILNLDTSIQSLLIDVSFPSRLSKLALESQHLTPTLLAEMLSNLKQTVSIFPYHLKPAYQEEVIYELNQSPMAERLNRPLDSGDELQVFQSKIQIKHRKPSTSSEENNQLNSLLDIAQALSAETNLNRLLEMIVEQAIAFSHADGGTLYRLSADKKELEFTVVQNQSLNIKMGGTAEKITWNNLPLYLEDGSPNVKMVAALCALNKEVVVIDDIYHEPLFNFNGTKAFDESTGYHSTSTLVIPLLDQNQSVIGVLQLINRQNDAGQTVPFRELDQRNAKALASQAAISLTKTILLHELETLFESMIGTITKAFDEKCSFTGGHVRFVAELSQIIAKGLDQDETFYPEVRYSPEDLHSIKMAALLHDVGKIATPEFIMQKATKLEKTVDRIHALKARTEIIKRDAHIAYLEAQCNHLPAAQVSELKTAYDHTVNQLDDFFKVVENTNKGLSYLTDAQLETIESATQFSYESDGVRIPLLSEDEKQNLSIRNGTLNQAEREKIMDHARVSLEILQTLPFPKKYQNIVNIAANHHEKLDGSGYPRGLTAEQLSLEDRILILADLYEALSSKDRPYKDPKPLSEITRILSFMANDGHIDKKLLRFFFESGTYKNFNTNLQANQLDELELNLK